MSIQIIDQPGSLGTQLGAGFGKGLAESLPKGIQQGRLSGALKSLQGQNLNPLQQMAHLMGIGGASSEEAARLQPLIQQAQARYALEQEAKEGAPSVAGGGAPASAQVVAPSQFRSGTHPYATPEQLAEFKQSLVQEPDTKQINRKANQYISQGRTADVNEARQMALRDMQQDITAQQTKRNTIRSQLQERVGSVFDRSSLGDFSEIKSDLLDKAEYEAIKKGQTPEQAATTFGNEVRALDKAATQTAALGGFPKFLNSFKSLSSSLKSEARAFDRLGYGEQFQDLASAKLDISPTLTASILDPIKNRDLQKEISNLPSGRSSYSYKELPEEKLNKLVSKIKPEDNLLSVMEDLRNRKIDITGFRNKVLDLADAGSLKLTPQQQRQLDKAVVSKPSWGDLFFKAR